MRRVATLAEIKSVLLSRRFPLASERVLQTAIEVALTEEGICFQREYRLSDWDRPDFYFEGGIVAEVKVKGSRSSIYRQCVRYCEHSQVSALILVSNVAMGLPQSICGKPASIVQLGLAWL